MRANNGEGFEEVGVDKRRIRATLETLKFHERIDSYMEYTAAVTGTTWKVRLPNFGTILALSNSEVVAFLIGHGVWEVK